MNRSTFGRKNSWQTRSGHASGLCFRKLVATFSTMLFAGVFAICQSECQADDPNFKLIIEHSLDRVGSQEPLKISLESKADNASQKEVADGAYQLQVTIKNSSDQEVLIWPFIALQIRAQGVGKVKMTRNNGRWGRLKAPSKIESVQYVTLKPGSEHVINVNLKQFNHDVRALKGWSLSPGKYKIDFSYRVDRAKLKKTMGKRCQSLNDPDKPWNRMVEVDWKKSIDLKVTR